MLAFDLTFVYTRITLLCRTYFQKSKSLYFVPNTVSEKFTIFSPCVLLNSPISQVCRQSTQNCYLPSYHFYHIRQMRCSNNVWHVCSVRHENNDHITLPISTRDANLQCNCYCGHHDKNKHGPLEFRPLTSIYNLNTKFKQKTDRIVMLGFHMIARIASDGRTASDARIAQFCGQRSLHLKGNSSFEATVILAQKCW